MPERVTFATTDGVEIVGDWVTATTTMGAVVLLHMMPATRQSWMAFQRVLAQRGLTSLAIDLRGHGESTHARDGSVLDYKKFSETYPSVSAQDLAAAVQWIRKRGVERTRIAVGGASIGANLALQFLADEPQTPAALLLSPGENYHGVSGLDAAPNVLPHQSVWMAASAGDDDESARALQVIDSLLVVEHKVAKKLQGVGHGTQMFEADPALMEEAADWLRDRVLGV